MIKAAAFGTAVALDSSLFDRTKVLCVCVNRVLRRLGLRGKLRGVREYESGQNCVMQSFVISTLQHTLLGR